MPRTGLRGQGTRPTLEEVAESPSSSIDGMQVWTGGHPALARWLSMSTLMAGLVWWMDLLPAPLIIVAWTFGVLRSAEPVRKKGVLSIDARGVFLDGAMVASRHAVVLAFRPVPVDPNRVRIACGTARAPIDIEAPDAPSATRILMALGTADPQRSRTAAFVGTNLAYPEAPATIAMAAAGWIIAALSPFPALADVPQLGGLAFVIAGSIVVPYLMRVRLEIGADGLLLIDRHGPRFVAYANLDEVVEGKGKLTIALRSGAPISIRFPSSESGGQAAEVRARVYDALQQARARGGGRGETHALLARGGRDVKSWMHAAAALTSAEADHYRIAAVTHQELWDKVENGSVAPTVRIGAALALRPVLDADGRERLRIASMASVAPEVRTSFTAIAEAEDETLLESKLRRVE
ncbi:hypothetical protein LVJ94_36390 [Pendulispora rubella]|uniref:PH domain-containing protein n=1 Tax=Pendulispora rubella TaxID=2741070 RepID=A0ABZ2L1B4_9BACT